jgi:hypothetical protein
MKNLNLVLLFFGIAFYSPTKAHAINRCTGHNQLICKYLKDEFSSNPNKNMIFFIKAIIEKESGWDTRTMRTEPDGRQSYGLMHVLDETANQMGLADERELLIPEIGLKYGIKYASKKLKDANELLEKAKLNPNMINTTLIKQHSVWSLAAAAYNAGSVRFRKNGTLISHREALGNGQYLNYYEAVTNLMEAGLSECREIKIEEICSSK